MQLHLFFYTIFLWLYQTGIQLVSPWNPRARLWLRGRKHIRGKIRALRLPAESPVIWMHCASLGEFEQGRPIVERLKVLHPSCSIVLTFFSPSGYEVRKDYRGADQIFYLPLDSPKNARIFLRAIRPKLVLWIKYDYWYYYLHELNKRRIPVLLISSVFRSGQPFFKWYGRLHRTMLGFFDHLFVQSADSKNRLANFIPNEKITVSGDTRFDRVIEIAEQFKPNQIIEQFCGAFPVVVAGSTWEEDEEELDHYANTHPEIRFIIAPHEIHEAHLREIEKLFRHSMRYSSLEKKFLTAEHEDISATGSISSKETRRSGSAGKANVLLIDNIGMLSALYRYGTVCYVGGGFGDDGVHNVLEAAVYGKPVVFGPVIEKYFEAMELVEAGGGIVIDSALEAESVFNRLFTNAKEYNFYCHASRDYVYSHRGASDKILAFIQENRLLTS